MVLGVDEACTNVIRYAYRLRDRSAYLVTDGRLPQMRARAVARFMANKSCPTK